MSSKPKKMTGRYNRLTVIKLAGRTKWGTVLWTFRCDCGNEVTKEGVAVRRGYTKSCGCLQREMWEKGGPVIMRQEALKRAADEVDA
jgi:hypothetical protein